MSPTAQTLNDPDSLGRMKKGLGQISNDTNFPNSFSWYEITALAESKKSMSQGLQEKEAMKASNILSNCTESKGNSTISSI